MKLVDAESRGFDPNRLKRIDDFLAHRYIDTGRLPNAQILIARDGDPVHFAQFGQLRAARRSARMPCSASPA